ncbi:MAG: prepilin-type N-terminal cleavage/methylation domain-containing protein, partial [Methanobacteriaceae archaeon]|nr:prepilin-type N-terminal cleavage/methylation domain-containing protein [Methanobacteriaceae archaeon]
NPNKKAFTLIELLAVIVILAIIALIAVPIVLNIINDSKQQARKRSAELYKSAVLNAVMKKQLDGKTQVPDGTYEVQKDGSLMCSTYDTCNDTKIEVEVDGERPQEGDTLIIEDG